jgi:hypothetical protein
LTALSFCDLFSCFFAILNVLEYLLPFYLEMDSLRYHELCQSLQIYTHPIATTLQALSCWLICAFSIHRCKSIAKPTEWFWCLKKDNASVENMSANKRKSSVFRQMWLRMRPSLSGLEDNVSTSSTKLANTRTIYEMTVNDMHAKTGARLVHYLSTISRARLIIILLYVSSIVYLIPQWFEKKLTYIEIQNRVYVFTTITEFGQSKMYRQVFHLWFYMLAIYIIPFLLILFFNLILLRTFLDSKKKCSQYKLKNDANSIIKDLTSSMPSGGQVTSLSQGINGLREGIQALEGGSELPLPAMLRKEAKPRKISASLNSNRMRILNKSRALTLTLFGVVAIFFACHFPAAVTKIIYVLYPKVEFESVFASFFLDLSNFLIMLNSSINFLLYIVFGPGKFRQEFSYVFFTVLKCFKSKSVDDNSVLESFAISEQHLPSATTTMLDQATQTKKTKKLITIVENEEVGLKQTFNSKQYNTLVSAAETSDTGNTKTQETICDE